MSGAVEQKRAQAFAHLDEAKLGWFHLRAVLVSGVGFFTDAYDIFVISQCLPMIYQVYYPQYVKGSFPAHWTSNGNNIHLDALLKASTNWGNFIGQLGFGYLGDKLGRKKMYGIELIIMMVCTVGSAMAAPAARGFSMVVVLTLWRIGILVGGVVFVTTLSYMKSYILADYMNLDYVWRIALGVGVIPAVIAVYFRLTIPETPRYTVDVVGDADKAERDVEKVLALNEVRDVTTNWGQEQVATTKVVVKQNDFASYFGKWNNLKVLIGTAYTWFALDIAWYGLSLNQSTILGLINFNGPSKISGYCAVNPSDATQKYCPSAFVDPTASVYDYFYQRAIGNIIIACAGTVPGYWVTVLLIEKLGRKPIQFLGFGVITVVLLALAIGWTTISTNVTTFMTLFTIAQFFFNFGPNSTTFVVPGEVFPTRWRSTGHGISAAMGKVGAILGIQAVGPYFTDNAKTVLYTFAVVMATGFIATFLIPETKGKTLEELSQEDTVFVDEVEFVDNVKA
ncbi:major facilitator superfamily domain-containing protein [Zopfochytrium polystomum]|nr:major facilitator superfamily domain-containing protein [Zopfochytrium polystomum]